MRHVLRVDGDSRFAVGQQVRAGVGIFGDFGRHEPWHAATAIEITTQVAVGPGLPADVRHQKIIEPRKTATAARAG